MNKLGPIFIAISLAVAGVVYLSSENIVLAGGVLLIYFIASFILFIPMLIKYKNVTYRFHECYHFINNFIISLSIKKSIAPSLESTSLSMDEHFQEMVNKIELTDVMDKLRYLNGSYFPFHTYRLFIQVVEIFQEQGGDILSMAKYLLQEIRHVEEYISSSSEIAKRKYIEIGTLWMITLSILVFMRFSLRDFFSYIKTQSIFIISLVVLALFILFSIFVLITRSTSIELKGYDKNEKII